jgi:serine protease Do
MSRPTPHVRPAAVRRLLLAVVALASGCAHPMADGSNGAAEVESAIARVRPSLVRIRVVSTDYRQGRELKSESFGSGAIVRPEGHVITNHHVAGHAIRLFCTLSSKEELEAELIGVDPLTDLAVIQLKGEAGRVFPTVEFGDSDALRVGDTVLALGSPLALSQSVTQGIVSNTEMIMPEWRLEQDGEYVGTLVRWIGHDAAIYGGNSGGPLVDLGGRIIGINELGYGLSGAIPGNLAKTVADRLIADGAVKRSWLGAEIQPRFKSSSERSGALVAGVIEGTPAHRAGLRSGDLLVELAGETVDVRYAEQLPELNRLISQIPIGETVDVVVLREGGRQTLRLTTDARESVNPRQREIKPWGMTARDISLIMSKELKRPNRDGVLITSSRQGGPVGEAKPAAQPGDVIVAVNDRPIRNVAELVEATEAILEGKTEPTPVLATFDRRGERMVTVVEVGSREPPAPAVDVRRPWIPIATQVITRPIAAQMGEPELRGFRVTRVHAESAASAAGLQVGDLIAAVDGERLTASAPEHGDELAALIRQYREGDRVELDVRRGAERMKVAVALERAPKPQREMKKYIDEEFEVTVRDLAFNDRSERQLPHDHPGALVDEVKTAGWAALGGLTVGDIVMEVNGRATPDVEAFEAAMEAVVQARPEAVIFRVLRGIHTVYLEVEPNWSSRQ